jgi:hypothetical protein
VSVLRLVRNDEREGFAYALSMLLNRALQTSILGLAFMAMSRISVPICSPSRSQSVQMKSMLHCLACCSMLVATAFLSWSKSAGVK